MTAVSASEMSYTHAQWIRSVPFELTMRADSQTTGACIMYDKDPISSQQTDEIPCVSTAALTTHDVPAEPTFISLHQLRCAVVELSTALNETLRHQRGNAAACLQRAQAILQAVDGTPPQLSKFNSPRGLAPWQVRRVMVYVEAN